MFHVDAALRVFSFGTFAPGSFRLLGRGNVLVRLCEGHGRHRGEATYGRTRPDRSRLRFCTAIEGRRRAGWLEGGRKVSRSPHRNDLVRPRSEAQVACRCTGRRQVARGMASLVAGVVRLYFVTR